MMKKVIRCLLFCLALVVSGCTIYDIDEILLSQEDVSLTWKGEEVLVYDPDKWQMGYNQLRNEFRVHDDQMADYFVVRCDAVPTDEGQELKADVQWTEKSSIKKLEGIRLEVKKVSADGYVWLWGNAHGVGIVVRKL